MGSVESFLSFLVKPHPGAFNTLRSMLRELNSERWDFKVSEPHTAHPDSSKFEGAVASQNPLIIFLCVKMDLVEQVENHKMWIVQLEDNSALFYHKVEALLYIYVHMSYCEY